MDNEVGKIEVPFDLDVVEIESDSLNLVGEASKPANALDEDAFLGLSSESDMGDDEGVNCSALKKLGGLFIGVVAISIPI